MLIGRHRRDVARVAQVCPWPWLTHRSYTVAACKSANDEMRLPYYQRKVRPKARRSPRTRKQARRARSKRTETQQTLPLVSLVRSCLSLIGRGVPIEPARTCWFHARVCGASQGEGNGPVRFIHTGFRSAASSYSVLLGCRSITGFRNCSLLVASAAVQLVRQPLLLSHPPATTAPPASSRAGEPTLPRQNLPLGLEPRHAAQP